MQRRALKHYETTLRHEEHSKLEAEKRRSEGKRKSHMFREIIRGFWCTLSKENTLLVLFLATHGIFFGNHNGKKQLHNYHVFGAIVK